MESSSELLRTHVRDMLAVENEMLHATALAAGNEKVAALALRYLEDYARLVIRTTEVLPHALVKELSREGKLPDDRTAASRAVENAKRAWMGGAAMSMSG